MDFLLIAFWSALPFCMSAGYPYGCFINVYRNDQSIIYDLFKNESYRKWRLLSVKKQIVKILLIWSIAEKIASC